MAWYNEQILCKKKWAKVRQWYLKQCPPGKRQKSFPLMQYMSWCKAEKQRIYDEEYKMMHLGTFQIHAKSPEHYPPNGLCDADAEVEFNRLAGLEDAITDLNGKEGHGGKYLMRVAVHEGTTMKKRDVTTEGQGYNLNDKQVKNATQKDVDMAYNRVHTNLDEAAGTETISAVESFRLMNKGASEGVSGFDGKVASLGNIQSLKNDLSAAELAKKKKREENGDDGEDESSDEDGRHGDGDGSAPGAGTAKKKPKTEAAKVWMERDVKVGEAQRAQESWLETSKSTLNTLYSVSS